MKYTTSGVFDSEGAKKVLLSLEEWFPRGDIVGTDITSALFTEYFIEVYTRENNDFKITVTVNVEPQPA